MGRFKSRALTAVAWTNERSTIGKVREKSSNGVMEEGLGKVPEGGHSRPSAARTRYAIEKVREVSSNGVMEEYSGKVQKVSAHVDSIFIVMDLAIVESHVAVRDVKTPALQKYIRERSRKRHPTG